MIWIYMSEWIKWGLRVLIRLIVLIIVLGMLMPWPKCWTSLSMLIRLKRIAKSLMCLCLGHYIKMLRVGVLCWCFGDSIPLGMPLVMESIQCQKIKRNLRVRLLKCVPKILYNRYWATSQCGTFNPCTPMLLLREILELTHLENMMMVIVTLLIWILLTRI